MKLFSSLTGGALYDRFCKVRANFYEKIDETVHAATYEGEHELLYAEPEFTGKFMDICAYYYERERDERALKKGMAVIDSIKRNIRSDGYLGMLGAGNERKKFSVWNHAFTLYGLTRMYTATKDETIRELVIRAADWILCTFTGEGHPDILEASNKGCENITCFFSMLCAYEVTGERSYLDFVGDTIAYCETTDMNLLSFDNVLSLRSQKGIEMLVVYLGVLKYGILTQNQRALDAARRYFEDLRKTQIRNTGNGTIRESWTENGNAPRLMPTEEKPNETCVAVGLVELSASLFYVFRDARYLDDIEKSLFNHICGSLEKSGSDLAYYQGNYGKKIYRTAGGFYQCCRYRGFTLFSYLNEMLYYFDGETLIPMIYATSELACDGVFCKQSTDFPCDGSVTLAIKNDRPVTLKLRVPTWCKAYSLTVNGKNADILPEEQYLVLKLLQGEHEVVLCMKETVEVQAHTIDGSAYLSITCGPMLMTHDTHFGGALWQPLAADASFVRADPKGEAMIKLCGDEMTLVDFASAGSNDPQNDLYTVFIPQKGV